MRTRTHNLYVVLGIALLLIGLAFLFAAPRAYACPNWFGTPLCKAPPGHSFGKGGASYSNGGQALIICPSSGQGGGGGIPVCKQGSLNSNNSCGGNGPASPVLPPAASAPIVVGATGSVSSAFGSFPVNVGGGSASQGGGGSGPQIIPPAQLSISAVPGLIRIGESTTLTWGSQNAQACTVSGPFVDLAAVSGSEIVEDIIGRSDYVLACIGEDGLNYSAQTTVHVVPQWQEF